MPTPASPGSNQFRCDSCGRFFNTSDELRTHETECQAAKAAGSPGSHTGPGRQGGPDDREWVSTP